MKNQNRMLDKIKNRMEYIFKWSVSSNSSPNFITTLILLFFPQSLHIFYRKNLLELKSTQGKRKHKKIKW